MMGSANFDGCRCMDEGVRIVLDRAGSSVGSMDVPTVDRHI
jgi:hypothetical protein